MQENKKQQQHTNTQAQWKEMELHHRPVVWQQSMTLGSLCIGCLKCNSDIDLPQTAGHKGHCPSCCLLIWCNQTRGASVFNAEKRAMIKCHWRWIYYTFYNLPFSNYRIGTWVQLPSWGETLHYTNTFTFVIKKKLLDRQTNRLVFNYLTTFFGSTAKTSGNFKPLQHDCVHYPVITYQLKVGRKNATWVKQHHDICKTVRDNREKHNTGHQ